MAELKKIELPRDISFGGYYYEVHCKCTSVAGAREAQETIDYWNRRATDGERLTQRYRVVCDRCGKEWEADETQTSSGLFPVLFAEDDAAIIGGKAMAHGGVCEECYKDFCEIAENFFDDVNRRATDERAD